MKSWTVKIGKGDSGVLHCTSDVALEGVYIANMASVNKCIRFEYLTWTDLLETHVYLLDPLRVPAVFFPTLFRGFRLLNEFQTPLSGAIRLLHVRSLSNLRPTDSLLLFIPLSRFYKSPLTLCVLLLVELGLCCGKIRRVGRTRMKID